MKSTNHTNPLNQKMKWYFEHYYSVEDGLSEELESELTSRLYSWDSAAFGELRHESTVHLKGKLWR